MPLRGDNPYWAAVCQLPQESEDGRRPYASNWKQFCRRYAWAIPSPAALQWIRGVLTGIPVVECGAGTGYWAWQMQQSGVDVLACDRVLPPNGYAPIALWDAAEAAAAHPDHALMLCWPSYESSMAAQALRAYRGDLLLYIGEPRGGNAANEAYFDLLEQATRCREHVSWWAADDAVTLYRRRRPGG